MSLTVTQRPSTTISGETSKWNAVGNPLLYKMQRKDFTFASVNNSGGLVQLVISGDVSASFAVGDSVYFSGGGYTTNTTVTAVSYSAPNTLVTLNKSYISSSTGYINNDTLRPNYAVGVFVYNSDDEALNTEPFLFTPFNDGSVTIDIRAILKANLSPDFSGDLSSTTKIFEDSDVYLKFYIKYSEVWTDSAEGTTNDTSNQFFAVYGSNQIPAPYGGNLAKYVTFLDGTPAGYWLTELDTVVFWRGYPCLVSLIVGDNVNVNVYADADGDQSTPASYQGNLITVDLNQLIVDQSIESADLVLYKSGPTALSQTLPIVFRDACDEQILLIGRNKRGGMLSWMFDVGQEYTFDYANGIKAARKTLRTENLTLTQWEALQDFITLGDVYRNNIVELTSSTNKTTSKIGQQLYTVDADGTKTGVICVPRAASTNTKQIKHFFEIEIEYPIIL